jgi:hypothetical protein
LIEEDYSRVTWHSVIDVLSDEFQQELEDLYASYGLDFEEGMHLACLS